MRIKNIIQQMKYNTLLQTFEWKIKAHEIKKRDGYRCQYCGSPYELHAHHLVYLKLLPWQYPSNYYITLCSKCHLFEHACIDAIDYDITEALLSGLLAIDIYKKLKGNEGYIK